MQPHSIEIIGDASGTRYHLILTQIVSGVCIAWPEVHWSMSVGLHVPPEAGYLRSQWLKSRVDCDNIAKMLATVWPQVQAWKDVVEVVGQQARVWEDFADALEKAAKDAKDAKGTGG